MRAIDSLLGILVQQGGDELRLVADRRPRMFNGEAELALTMPAMSAEAIQQLLGDVWTTHQAELRSRGSLSLAYSGGELGPFALTLAHPDGAGLEVTFRRGEAAATPTPPTVADAPAAASGGELPPALAALLVRAHGLGASDVHLSPRRPPIARVNGVLTVLEDAAAGDATSLLGGRALDGASVDRALDVPGVGRIRVNVYASDEGVVRGDPHPPPRSAGPGRICISQPRSRR